MVVDLPAPFGPTKPVSCPGCTVNVMPSRASVGPKRLRSPVTSIVASLICCLLVVGGQVRTWFYARAGVSAVSPADTGLTPVTWQCLA